MKNKKRLDVLLTELGYADSRSKAQAIIMSGLVYVCLLYTSPSPRDRG